MFLTASATLKEQVARAFHKLQAAALADSLDVLVDYLHASSEEYATLAQVPDAAFPLFVTTKTFLRMLDGTVKSPFFPRRENGTVLMPLEEIDPDGMGIEIDLDYTGGEDDEEFEDLDDAASSAFGGQRGQEGQLNRGRQEISYQFFVDTMWKKITTKEERAKLKPPLVYQEIMSYLKACPCPCPRQPCVLWRLRKC